MTPVTWPACGYGPAAVTLFSAENNRTAVAAASTLDELDLVTLHGMAGVHQGGIWIRRGLVR